MSFIEEQEAILKTRIHPQNIPADFESFWRAGVEEMRKTPIRVERRRVETPYDRSFTTYELKWNTHDDTIITAWFAVPNGSEGKKLPCTVYYHGASTKRNLYPSFPDTGVCYLSMDVRGQGGTSPDLAAYHSQYNGNRWTCGILDRNEAYQRNIFLDAVRAVDVAATLPEVDPAKIFTSGGSQGGALSIVGSALSGKSIRCYSWVTAFCCLRCRVESAKGAGSFAALHEFLRNHPQHTDTVYENLAYFDMLNMVSLLKVPTAFCPEDMRFNLPPMLVHPSGVEE